MNKQSATILAIAFVIGSLILGIFFKLARTNESYVTVKGLSEREVVAERAWMAINTSFGANTADDVRAKMRAKEKTIINFLKEKGFTDAEIKTDNINIYENNYQNATFRYKADIRVTVNSNDIDKVEVAAGDKTTLIENGVFISGDKWANGPKYYFTKFTDVKTEMIAEATREAKRAAQEFAKNSGASVGNIRRANQGIFQILPSDRSNEDASFFKEKIIRVVSTLDFYLD